MSLLMWNYRGFGNPHTQRELGDYIKAKDPTVVFLAKTQADDARLKRVLRNFEFKNKWSAPSNNCGGGLVLLWKESISLKVEDSSKYCIDTIIDKNTPKEWRFTGFYGQLVTSKRHEAQAKLRALNNKPHIPWQCAGDFNEIVMHEEKVGGSIRGQQQMQLFREGIDECEFMDLGFVGPSFTWSKHFENGNSIWERLDCGLATNAWFIRHPGTRVHHLSCLSSGHCPLFINPTGIDAPNSKKPFRSDEIWLLDSQCEEVVETACSSCVSMRLDSAILGKIDKCGRDLSWWNKTFSVMFVGSLAKKGRC